MVQMYSKQGADEAFLGDNDESYDKIAASTQLSATYAHLDGGVLVIDGDPVGGGGGGITTEQAVDAVAAALTEGANIGITYDDGADTITIAVTGLSASVVGLGNVDNTSDANKPVSTATQVALDGKARCARR